jgi:hypothetical protein
LRYLRPFFAYNETVTNVRSCLVSFTDAEGIEHSIRVPAESLYEAAVEAMAAFRRGAFAEMTFGAGTQLRIRVRAPEEEHVVTVGKVLSWLDGEESERVGEEESVEGAVEEVSRGRTRSSLPPMKCTLPSIKI